MARRTSIDEVEAAVAAVKLIQEQLDSLAEAVERLTERVDAITQRLPPRDPHA